MYCGASCSAKYPFAAENKTCVENCGKLDLTYYKYNSGAKQVFTCVSSCESGQIGIVNTSANNTKRCSDKCPTNAPYKVGSDCFEKCPDDRPYSEGDGTCMPTCSTGHFQSLTGSAQ